MKSHYYLALVIMTLLSPLGLLTKGTAWGEWGTDEISEMIGFVPAGLEEASSWWSAVIPDYRVEFLGEGLMADNLGYILSAILGALLIYNLTILVGKCMVKRSMQSI